MKRAEPFFNFDGEVATAQDFQAMFGGRQNINPMYTKAEELTDSFVSEYFAIMVKTFEEVAREHMYSKKECWETLCETKPMKAMTEKKLRIAAQDVLRGEHIPSVSDCQYVMRKYKKCPMYEGLILVAGHELPKKFSESHSLLVSMAS